MLIVASMRDFYNKLCLLILEEHFGPLVKCIGNNLLHGAKTLQAIRFGTRLSEAKVQEGLCVLIKHSYVTCQKISPEENDVIEYSLDQEQLIMILRYPRYMFFTKTYCGDKGEIMLEEILKHGDMTATEVIIKTYRRLEKAPNNSNKEVSLPSLKDTFELLVKNQFLMRSLSFDTSDKDERPDYNLPELDLGAIHQTMQGEEADPGDSAIYWKVNVDRFTQDFRDQIVVSAMTQRFNDSAGKLMQQLIHLMYMRTASWSDTSNPIPYTEIKEEVKKLDCPELEQHLDQYLQIMEEDSSQFIKRVGDSGGGQYSIDMKNAFKQLAWVTLENIVTERFGSKPARIFRLVRKDSAATLEQIQQIAMIPAKEAKFFVYALVQDNYIQIQELRKGGTSAFDSRKASFRFYVDLSTVVEMEMEHCCQALYNIIQRRNHESASNKRMIEKQLRVQILSANMKEHGATEQQLTDIADMMTPSENEQLEKAQKAIKGLAAAEFDVDETLFLLMMYEKYK